MPRTSRISFLSQIAPFSQFQVWLIVTEAKQIIDHFYPAMSYRRVQKRKRATNHFVRLGRSLWSAISRQGTSRAPNCNIFSVSSILKHNAGKTNNKFISSQQFLSGDISTSSKKKKKEESDELLCTVRSLVMVCNRLPAQGVNPFREPGFRVAMLARNLLSKNSTSAVLVRPDSPEFRFYSRD